MILSDVRTYLRTHKRVALADLANRFDTDPDALRGMLDRWIAKGSVRKLPAATSMCATDCGKCDQVYVEIYEWAAKD